MGVLHGKQGGGGSTHLCCVTREVNQKGLGQANCQDLYPASHRKRKLAAAAAVAAAAAAAAAVAAPVAAAVAVAVANAVAATVAAAATVALQGPVAAVALYVVVGELY